MCADGAAPLLKPVIGKAGDEIVLSPAGIAVNGKLLPIPRRWTTTALDGPSRTGRSAVTAHRPGMLWVASSYNPRSYDSRYLGPIPQSAVRGRLRILLAR